MYLLGLTLPVNPSDCFEKSYKNKAFINVNIMHFRERLVCRNALGDTHTHSLRVLDSVNMTSVHPDRPDSG